MSYPPLSPDGWYVDHDGHARNLWKQCAEKDEQIAELEAQKRVDDSPSEMTNDEAWEKFAARYRSGDMPCSIKR